MDRSRFAEEAVAAGYLTSGQLDRVLFLQASDLQQGRIPRPVGIICLELGWLSYEQMVDALRRAEARPAGRAATSSAAPRRRIAARKPGALIPA